MLMTEKQEPAKVQGILKHGNVELTISAQKWLTIETSPSGVEIHREQVPAGKVWKTWISITIREESA